MYLKDHGLSHTISMIPLPVTNPELKESNADFCLKNFFTAMFIILLSIIMKTWGKPV